MGESTDRKATITELDAPASDPGDNTVVRLYPPGETYDDVSA